MKKTLFYTLLPVLTLCAVSCASKSKQVQGDVEGIRYYACCHRIGVQVCTDGDNRKYLDLYLKDRSNYCGIIKDLWENGGEDKTIYYSQDWRGRQTLDSIGQNKR